MTTKKEEDSPPESRKKEPPLDGGMMAKDFLHPETVKAAIELQQERKALQALSVDEANTLS